MLATRRTSRARSTIAMAVLTLPALMAVQTGCQAPGLRPEAEYLQASPADMQWFKDARFGLFIHWGPVSIKGTEIGWSRDAERPGRKGRGEVPVEVYDNLYKQFNPVKFNADEWVALAREAGMKYLVFTTKHHDGFCMFDTKLSEYKITNSPFKRDVCKELADACHRGGLKLGWYYSPPDWHHPDYRTENHRRYIEYMHGQLRELCTNYGKVDIIWFDGLGGSAEDWDSRRLFKMLRTLQPGILLNNRAGLPADWDTPEQKIGSMANNRAWETCMTIGDQWAYKPDDRIKSLKECLHALVLCSGGSGNLLFNVGPRPDGSIEPLQVERLKEMGKWLRANGESIYGTAGGPYARDYWGVSTRKGSNVYLHVLGWEDAQVTVPAPAAKVVSARLTNGDAVAFQQNDEGVTVTVPKEKQNALDTVVVLEMGGPTQNLTAARPRSGSVALNKNAWQSGTGAGDKDNPPYHAFDDDYNTSWGAILKEPPACLGIDLGKVTRIDRVRLCEILDRTREFVVEGRANDTDPWKKLSEGTMIGQTLTLRFPPTEVRFVRLRVSKGDGRYEPRLAEFQVFSPK